MESSGLIELLKAEGAIKELPKNAVPLEFIVYYIKDGKGKAPQYVRLFKSDTGYEIKNCALDEVLLTLGENDIKFTQKTADIVNGDWAGIHMSSKDEDILPFISMIAEGYRQTPKDELLIDD